MDLDSFSNARARAKWTGRSSGALWLISFPRERFFQISRTANAFFDMAVLTALLSTRISAFGHGTFHLSKSICSYVHDKVQISTRFRRCRLTFQLHPITVTDHVDNCFCTVSVHCRQTYLLIIIFFHGLGWRQHQSG